MNEMLRLGLAVSLVALAACAPPIPDSNPQPRGVGFGDYSQYQRYTAPLPDRRTTVTPPPVVATATPPGTVPAPNAPPVRVPPPTAVAAATPPPNTAPLVAPGTVPAGGGNNAGISDEQDFNAVSNRVTIEDDAARLRASTAAFTEVTPEPVPSRSGDGANVVAYALSTQHEVGTKVHSRTPVSQSRYDRNCAGYATNDLAQEAFLKAGGPNKDRLKLDPDGDGYACSWNPGEYRRLAGR